MTFVIEIGKTVFRAKIKKVGGSKGIILSPQILEFLGAELEDDLAIKFEKGKHGPYIGVGLLKIKDAIPENGD